VHCGNNNSKHHQRPSEFSTHQHRPSRSRLDRKNIVSPHHIAGNPVVAPSSSNRSIFKLPRIIFCDYFPPIHPSNHPAHPSRQKQWPAARESLREARARAARPQESMAPRSSRATRPALDCRYVALSRCIFFFSLSSHPRSFPCAQPGVREGALPATRSRRKTHRRHRQDSASTLNALSIAFR
jgi:hypothetical protein